MWVSLSKPAEKRFCCDSLSGQKRRGVLNSDLSACLCLFNVIVYSLTAIRAEAAQSSCREDSRWSWPGEVGVCCLAQRRKEPSPRPKHLPTQNIIAMGMVL